MRFIHKSGMECRVTTIRIVSLMGMAFSLLALEGRRSTPAAGGIEPTPKVLLRGAPLVQFRGANSAAPDQPGDTDCNNPASAMTNEARSSMPGSQGAPNLVQ